MTDHSVGRVIDAIEQTGQLDNTLVIFVYGDNGTSAEGGRNGMFSEMTYFNGVTEAVPDMLKMIDTWGGHETYPHMASGWAVMFDTPYTWTKQVASDSGGTKVGMAIHSGMTENVFINIKKSKTITAEIEVPEGTTAHGTLIAQGGRFGGWSLYVKDGVPAYLYNRPHPNAHGRSKVISSYIE